MKGGRFMNCMSMTILRHWSERTASVFTYQVAYAG